MFTVSAPDAVCVGNGGVQWAPQDHLEDVRKEEQPSVAPIEDISQVSSHSPEWKRSVLPRAR